MTTTPDAAPPQPTPEPPAARNRRLHAAYAAARDAWGERDGRTVAARNELVAANLGLVWRHVLKVAARRGLAALLGGLGDREREWVARRYGLGGREPETFKAIGLAHGVNRERVRQIIEAALGKLRRRAGVPGDPPADRPRRRGGRPEGVPHA